MNVKGIVAGIRRRGGSFLELDERSGKYFDIGDPEAIKKVRSQLDIEIN